MGTTLTELEREAAAHPRLDFHFDAGRLKVSRAPYCECCTAPLAGCVCFGSVESEGEEEG